MANPSRPPTYKDFNVKPVCSGCGREFPPGYAESLWFVRRYGSPNGVYGQCCYRKAVR